MVACVAVLLCVPHSATAQVQLSDQNSTLNIVTNSSAGMDSWTIDGQNVLDQQWFWYRVGNVGGQSSLDTLPSTITLLDASDFKASYTGATFVVTLTLSLSGSTPGSGNSDLGIQIRIQNKTANTLNFHLFEYSNFHAGGKSGGYRYLPQFQYRGADRRTRYAPRSGGYRTVGFSGSHAS